VVLNRIRSVISIIECKTLGADKETCIYATVLDYINTLLLRRRIEKNKPAFAIHAQQISHFLSVGEGVWFDKPENGAIIFNDRADSTCDSLIPSLRHSGQQK